MKHLRHIFSKCKNQHGHIDLLIIQGSPFCNITCSYCYLPDRGIKKRITSETIRLLFKKITRANLVSKELSIVWHAGEPLTVPTRYYTEIFSIINQCLPNDVKVTHSFQTNGMLINAEWVRFFKEHNVNVGLSIDGPRFIHDRFRKKRNGKGTFDEAMLGVNMLRENRIDFHVIAVITEYSLDYPKEIFEFFLDLNVKRLGFNIEEIEGIHDVSSINSHSFEKVKKFLFSIFELQVKCHGKIIIREFESAFMKIVGRPNLGRNLLENTIPKSHLLKPYGILSVDHDGNFMTYSPELLGQTSDIYGKFSLGNVETDDFIEALEGSKHKMIQADINAGVEMCKNSCAYFKVCGGGAPSNKYYENGSFRSTETLYCKYTIQFPIDIVLENLENQYINQ